MLELDLRKPKLSKALGVSNSSGVTNYLVGSESLEQIIKKVPETERLYLIPSGPVPPNPVELLESDKMKQLLSILKEEFDYIIIDTSPVGLVADPKSLAAYADCSLFVVRFNVTPKAKLAEVAEDLDTASFKRIGIIFNALEINSSYGYYGYRYGNDGYGYFDAGKKSVLPGIFRSLKHRLT